MCEGVFVRRQHQISINRLVENGTQVAHVEGDAVRAQTSLQQVIFVAFHQRRREILEQQVFIPGKSEDASDCRFAGIGGMISPAGSEFADKYIGEACQEILTGIGMVFFPGAIRILCPVDVFVCLHVMHF
jgi:hypothetical protein